MSTEELKYFHGYCKSLAGQDWEDLSQSAWLRCLTYNYVPGRTILCTIARGLFLNEKKRKKLVPRSLGHDRNLYETEMANESVAHMLRGLSGKEMQVMNMRMQGYGAIEMAAMLGENVNTVKSRVLSGLKKARESAVLAKSLHHY